MSAVNLPGRVDEFGEEKPVDAVYDAGNASDVAAKRRAARRKDKPIDMVMRGLLADENGRQFVFWIVEKLAGVGGPALNPNSTEFSAFREGQRAVGMLVRDRAMEVSMQNYLVAVGENYGRDIDV